MKEEVERNLVDLLDVTDCQTIEEIHDDHHD